MEHIEPESDFNFEQGALPKTLKTLGILSLIMGGIMTAMSLWNVKTAYVPTDNDTQKMQQMLEQVEKNNPEKYDEAVTFFSYAGPQAIANVITQVISVMGVIMMLKLKKNGFYFYLLGELLPYVITLALLGIGGFAGPASFFGEKAQMVGYIVAIGMVVIDIVFIVLYAKQLKYMS